MRIRSVFITGASSGLGMELAKVYKSKGWRVGVCARRGELLEKLKQDFGVQVFQADVTKREELSEAIQAFGKEGLDLVIANAGKSYENKSRIPDFEVGRDLVEVNLIGAMNTFEPAIQLMLKQKSGHLAAVASIAGLNGLPGVSAYSASKAGVIKMCESLGLDLAKEGISTTVVCPGFIDTPLTRKNPHPMPFMVEASTAAQKIYEGIERKKRRIYFPFIFTCAVRILSLLPRGLYAKIMSMDKLNYSRES